MRRIAQVLLLTAPAGCVPGQKNPGYGSFSMASPALQKKIVDDMVKKLVALYPPAGTRFDLEHATADSFGTALSATLRAQGYALQEQRPAANPGVDSKSRSRVLAYVFDQPAGTDLYRVTLTIDDQTLSRVYMAKDGNVAAAGYWVRKE